MMDYLYESRVLLREEPSQELFAAKEVFVQEQNAFGRRSMRKVTIDSDSQKDMAGVSDSENLLQGQNMAQAQGYLWKESVYNPMRDGKLTELLYRKRERNGEGYSFVSCPFGEPKTDRHSQHEENEPNGRSVREKISGAAEDGLRCLNNRQRDYIKGIRRDQPVLYHRLDQRMLEIIGKLYEAGAYDGVCFFVTRREKLIIPQK